MFVAIKRWENAFALAVAANLAGKRDRPSYSEINALPWGAVIPPELWSVARHLNQYGGNSLIVPLLNAALTAARTCQKIEIWGEFACHLCEDILLPRIKIGEGVGQARKLVRWVGRAIRDGDQEIRPFLIERIVLAMRTTKEPRSFNAARAARLLLDGTNNGSDITYLLGIDGRRAATEKLAAMLNAWAAAHQ